MCTLRLMHVNFIFYLIKINHELSNTNEKKIDIVKIIGELNWLNQANVRVRHVLDLWPQSWFIPGFGRINVSS